MILSWDIGYKNLAYVLFEVDETGMSKIIKFDKISLTKSKKISKSQIIKYLYKFLVNFFPKIKKYNIEYSIIEKQVPKNIKAQWVHAGLNMYILTQGIPIKEKCAKHKFKEFGIKYNKKTKKKDAVIEFKSLISNKIVEINEITKFNNFTKQDDIADAFLLGYGEYYYKIYKELI